MTDIKTTVAALLIRLSTGIAEVANGGSPDIEDITPPFTIGDCYDDEIGDLSEMIAIGYARNLRHIDIRSIS